ncbi:hypothetical protein ILUMI_07188 [Ignelater luminosus]|uniref:GDT1 family protein n=1 Tax=Ignelater luminosus TaxID=2038154 RepID=A0A8K0DE07_IGNLU|nr:hypothetical protein ILUMI_07188 [Ignelater luminosus]
MVYQFKLKSNAIAFVINIFFIFFMLLTVGSAEKEPQEEESVNTNPSSKADLVGSTANGTPVENIGFIHAFVAAISVIIVSEIGDKTFFIAAIMAMRHPRLTVFSGAMTALTLMTVLSALFGWLANVIPRAYTFYISTALFAIFGLKMLKEGYHMSEAEAQEELEEFEKEAMLPDPESGTTKKKSAGAFSVLSRILLQSFTLTFLAEWGDRSQLTTIILGARENVTGVILGGILGHSVCTGMAVLGGRMIAQKISVRTVTIIGGVVFLLFAFSALFFDPNEE